MGWRCLRVVADEGWGDFFTQRVGKGMVEDVIQILYGVVGNSSDTLARIELLKYSIWGCILGSHASPERLGLFFLGRLVHPPGIGAAYR